MVFNEESKKEFMKLIKKEEMKINIAEEKIFKQEFVFEKEQKEVRGYIASVLNLEICLLLVLKKTIRRMLHYLLAAECERRN